MESFALYLLKSVIWLSGFAIIFVLFLKNERFFFLNRIYLITGILVAFIFPFFSVHYTVILPVAGDVNTDDVLASDIRTSGSNMVQIFRISLLILYTAGVVYVINLISRQARTIFRAIRKSEIISHSPAKLIKSPDYTSAFSFFSYVFVNPSITDVETKEIMIHELVHIRQKHWFDLLLVEMLCIIQWFNPLVWIYVRLIRQNHEYLADEEALQQTSDPAIYKAVLLSQIVGVPVVSLTNSFNYSPNKKRFNMMKNIITSPYRKMKVLFILPVFVIVLYSFAKPEYKYQYKETGIANQDQKSVKGSIFTKDEKKPLEGAIIVIQGTTIGTMSDKKGNFRLENVSEDATLVVSFVGFRSKAVKPDFNKDMLLEMTKDTVNYNLESVPPPPPPPPPPAPFETVIDQDTHYGGTDLNDGVIIIKTKKDSQKQEDKPFVVVEDLPQFPGGKEAMSAWIAAKVKYPKEAKSKNINGTVVVNITVTESGKVKNVEVVKSVDPLLDEEAVSAVKQMPDWKPGSQAGIPVETEVKIPVVFNLKD